MVEGRIHFGIQRDEVRVRVKGPRGAREKGRRAREEGRRAREEGEGGRAKGEGGGRRE